MANRLSGTTRRAAVLGLAGVVGTPVVGRVRATRRRTRDRPAWTFDTGAAPPHPVADGGLVLTTDASGAVQALDESTGRPSWQYSPSGSVSAFGLALSESRAAIGTDEGTLTALDASDGTVRWTASTNGAAAAVTQVGDGVLVTEADGSVGLFSTEGERRQRFEVPVVSQNQRGVPGGVTVPVADGDRIYVQNATAVHAFSVGDGTERWRTALPASHAGKRPVFPTADSVVVAANDRTSSLDRSTGRIRWESSVGGQTVNSPVTNGEIVASGDDSVQALFPAEAEIAWEVETDPYWSEGLAMAPDGETVYVAAIDGDELVLRALTASGGSTGWSHRLGTSDGFENYLTRPAVGSEHVFVSVEDREALVAVRRGGPAPSTASGTATRTPTGSRSGTGSEPETETEPATTVAEPGFGLGAGLASVAIAAWRLARRRER